MMRYLYLMLVLFLLLGCEDCSKPMKELCVERSSHIIYSYNPSTKTIMPIVLSKCVKHITVENECYVEKVKE